MVVAAGLWKGKNSVTIRLELSTQCQLSNRRSYFKVTTSIIKMPKEICDLSPVKSCSLSTKLVPSLAPVRKCSRVPRHYCHKTYVPRLVKKPIIIKWCIEEEQEEEQEEEEEEKEEQEEQEQEESATNPVLDTRLIFDDELRHEETMDHAEVTNPVLDARLLFNDEI